MISSCNPLLENRPWCVSAGDRISTHSHHGTGRWSRAVLPLRLISQIWSDAILRSAFVDTSIRWARFGPKNFRAPKKPVKPDSCTVTPGGASQITGNQMVVIWVFPKIVGFYPKSSILIGFSIIFTIHLGYPYFWKHPYRCHFGARVPFWDIRCS